MGYTTDFEGRFNLDKPLTVAHMNYLKAFNESRRMKRDATKTAKMKDPLREKVGLPVGEEGCYYVGAASDGDFGQSHTNDIIDYNTEPSSQPGLWCKWTPSEDGEGIEWDGNEKFYDYIDWLRYLIDNFLQPWGYVLNGEVNWQGEESSDVGIIVVKNNKVSTKRGRIVYDEDDD